MTGFIRARYSSGQRLSCRAQQSVSPVGMPTQDITLS